MATTTPTAATGTSSSTYSEGFFSSPTDVANAAIQTNLAVANIDRAVQAAAGGTSAAPQAWLDSWDAFKLVWQSFYNANFAGGDAGAWLTSDLEGSLEAYQKQVSNLPRRPQATGSASLAACRTCRLTIRFRGCRPAALCWAHSA